MSIPTTSVAPAAPATSSPLRPVASFIEWFGNIRNWILGLSPAGASRFESGATPAVASGMVAANGLSIFRYGKIVTLEGQVTRTAGAFGSTETAVFTIPAEYAPRVYRRLSLPMFGSPTDFGSMMASVNPDGTVSVFCQGAGFDIAYFCHSWKVA